HGRFATAALSRETQHPAPAEHEVAVNDCVHRLFAVAVINAEPVNLEYRFSGILPTPWGGRLRSRGRVGRFNSELHHLRHSKLGASEDACLPGGFARESRRSKPRVDEFVDPEVEKREAGTEERAAKAGRRPPPPPPAADGVVGESLAPHVAPIPQPWRRAGGRTCEAEER